MTMTHGGKRRRGALPALTPDQVRYIRQRRPPQMPVKLLMRELGVSRDTVLSASKGAGAYAGYPWPHELEDEHGR